MLGYVLGRAHWGKGLTVEAVRFVVNKVLELEGVYRAYACCDVENIASARVMEKAGLEKEGTLRRYVTCPNLGSIPRDCHLYAKVKL
jgi:RimJ/RimL family protein N-acetyltransferase